MTKVLGVLLVWGGCTGWGLCAWGALCRRARVLEDIGHGLALLEGELALNRAALPQLLERVSCRRTRQGGALFRNCVAELEKGKTFTDSWEKALQKSGLEERDRELLSDLSGLLGRYDAAEQGKLLTRLRLNWDEYVAYIRGQAGSLGKLYGVLGMAAGGFVGLMLV